MLQYVEMECHEDSAIPAWAVVSRNVTSLLDCSNRGYHVYQAAWEPRVGDVFVAVRMLGQAMWYIDQMISLVTKLKKVLVLR